MDHKLLQAFLFALEYMVVEKGFCLQCGECFSEIGWDDCYAKQTLKNCTKDEVCMSARRRALYKDKTRRTFFTSKCLVRNKCTIKFCRKPLASSEKPKLKAISCGQLKCLTGKETWQPTVATTVRTHRMSLKVTDQLEASDVRLHGLLSVLVVLALVSAALSLCNYLTLKKQQQQTKRHTAPS